MTEPMYDYGSEERNPNGCAVGMVFVLLVVIASIVALLLILEWVHA